MLELNLNLLVTFFWLALSAGLLLPGIWLLIDCQLNFKLINKGFIPKSYFLHFYLFGLLINIILFIFHLSYFLLFIIFILHLSRRLYECIYIHKFNSNSKLNIFHYLFGLIYYPCVGLTIIIDYKYSSTNINLIKYLFALIFFFNASYIQYNVHLTLAKIHNERYRYWIFNYISSPNYIAEIFIYISFLIASHRTSAMASLIVWVFINQSLSALLNHGYYKELCPSQRCTLIPFIL